ncbi:MAG TPA: uroporphyrinogen-III C-methyltransferase [Rudaea sp.]|jgi:uroporphyrin-3 C-methyltransferase|nr:uroporphyrinogen-III C-methyltransferase [Rudaea sp.]
MDESASIASETPRRRRAPLVILLVLLVAAAAAAAWWHFAPPRVDTAAQVGVLQAQVENLEHGIARIRGNTDTFRARLDDGDKVDASVRQQLLALGQRVQLAEDAVANLADRRLAGHDALALDEAELLLNLGGERYTLFHDATAAIAAYRLADAALAEVDDAAFSTVRQSIAGEIVALNDLHAADPQVLVVRLSHLRAQVPELARGGSLPPPAPAAANESWLARLFGTFVRVSHDTDTVQAQSAVRDISLARDLAVLDLRAAQAAALARDDAGFRAALAEARTQIATSFDTQAAQTAAVLKELDALAQAELAPPVPGVLGTALRELRNLRATHALAAAKTAGKHDEAKK